LIPVEYHQIVAKVDLKFNEIQALYPTQIQCGVGCSGCCSGGLTVSKVEQERIRHFLSERPDIDALVQGCQRQSQQNEAEHCQFLDTEQKCLIYEARPIICRSHGVPVFIRQGENPPEKRVCQLNFKELSLDNISNSAFINLEILNTILAAINEKYFAEDSRNRYALTRSAIMNEQVAYEI
jgi:Fe-S-cluster containining protein